MFYIAVVIFLLVEGLIVCSAFRYRRKPGDDELPPQTHGNNLVEVIWTLDPDGDRRVPVRLLVADAQRRRRHGQDRTSTSGPSPPASSGRSSTSTGRRPTPRCCSRSHSRRATTAAWPCRSACRSRSTSAPRTSSTRSTSRRSCSSGTSCRGRTTRSTSRSTTRARTAASARSCAAPSTARCCSTSTRRQGRLRRLAAEAHRRGQRHAAARRRRAGRRLRRPGELGRARSTSSTSPPRTSPPRTRRPARPFTIHFNNKDTGVPHNVDDQGRLGQGRLQGSTDHHRAGETRLRGAGARRGHLPVRLLGPSEHDRHAHGPVGSSGWPPRP